MMYKLTGEPVVEVDPFKGTVPMICPECDMAYYRQKNKQHDSCDFCGSTNIELSTHEHIIKLVEEQLLLDAGYYKVR